MSDKLYRLNELLNLADGRSLVVDTSNGLVLGALPGLEQFKEAVRSFLPLLDGIVTSSGQARNLGSRTRQDAALLVRADWTNALRRDEFVLPLENVEYIPLLEPSHALNLGANALVMHFILGHDEEIEAQCMQRTVNLALEGSNLGMPVIVDVQPIGSRVVLMNKAIELGVSFALEGGADGVAVPWPGSESFEIIETMCGCTPVWVKPLGLEADAPELAEALQLGATGIWLGESIFGDDDPVKSLKKYKSLVHAPLGAHEEGVA